MWDKVVQNLALYPSAVLTGVDADGYPFSIRCKPEIDAAQQVLRIQTAPNLTFQAGPAGLLCHYHNEELWDLNSFMVRGELEAAEGEWIFRPKEFYDGNAKGLALIGFVRKARREANNYLKKRGLSRPQIPWDEIEALKH